jgi:hypothetical protein
MSTESKTHRDLTEDALILNMKGETRWVGFVKVMPKGETRITLRKATTREIQADQTGVLRQRPLPLPM